MKIKGGYAVKFIMADGEEIYLCQGLSDKPARFTTKEQARKEGEFMVMGLDDDDYQSMNIVPYSSVRSES